MQEAYVGAPSRAEFPLTEEFARTSNNSTVGLSGKARALYRLMMGFRAMKSRILTASGMKCDE